MTAATGTIPPFLKGQKKAVAAACGQTRDGRSLRGTAEWWSENMKNFRGREEVLGGGGGDTVHIGLHFGSKKRQNVSINPRKLSIFTVLFEPK